MKHLIFVAILAIATVTNQQRTVAEWSQHMNSTVTSCRNSERPQQLDVDLFNVRKVPITQAGKCFVGCVYERRGFLKNGTFSRISADTMARRNWASNSTVLANVLRRNMMCETEVGPGSDKCVTGPKVFKCFTKYWSTIRSSPKK